MRETDFIGGLAKGLRVIEVFGENTPRLTITQVSDATGLDRATARRCLLTLSELGYAHYDGKYFELTPRVLRLGYSYLSATSFPKIIQPYLDQLSERVGQSASASVLDGSEIVYVARAAQRRVMSINLMPGTRLPAYCASMGRVLLASLPEAEAIARLEQSERPAKTQYTRTSISDLCAEFGTIRAQGYALNNQELELGLCSIAIPLFDRRGATIGALNIGAPAAIIPADEMPSLYLAPMQEVQRQVQALLG